jgi:hypothetical protein
VSTEEEKRRLPRSRPARVRSLSSASNGEEEYEEGVTTDEEERRLPRTWEFLLCNDFSFLGLYCSICRSLFLTNKYDYSC